MLHSRRTTSLIFFYEPLFFRNQVFINNREIVVIDQMSPSQPLKWEFFRVKILKIISIAFNCNTMVTDFHC